jgi:hypothetical protein
VFLSDTVDIALQEAIIRQQSEQHIDNQRYSLEENPHLETCREEEGEQDSVRIRMDTEEAFNEGGSQRDLGEVTSNRGSSERSRSEDSGRAREILQPTMENFRRIELKSQRRDIEGSIATSNIMALINRH